MALINLSIYILALVGLMRNWSTGPAFDLITLAPEEDSRERVGRIRNWPTVPSDCSERGNITIYLCNVNFWSKLFKIEISFGKLFIVCSSGHV